MTKIERPANHRCRRCGSTERRHFTASGLCRKCGQADNYSQQEAES
ncbi:hypothetical protein [Rhodococcus artemisiae]|uniref:Uncharacterized protein n=1 Tax=Rhodococcus artemisiae TaxID=714159 RepID=A0ABU7L4Z0_9NOCA|nr:hypothetical protein [Rhodococcus artemisiae]MEE2056604.1 hypothetical protein [Rhodococcus artemisiae]